MLLLTGYFLVSPRLVLGQVASGFSICRSFLQLLFVAREVHEHDNLSTETPDLGAIGKPRRKQGPYSHLNCFSYV